MTTAQLLDVLRDARDEGRWQEQAAIVEQIGADVQWVRVNYRLSPHMREDKLGKREIIAKLGWLRDHWPSITVAESRSLRVADGQFVGGQIGTWQELASSPYPNEWKRAYFGVWADVDE